jgi:hypothetical protein
MPSEMQCFTSAYTDVRIAGGKSFFVNLNQSVVHNQVRFVKGGNYRTGSAYKKAPTCIQFFTAPVLIREALVVAPHSSPVW